MNLLQRRAFISGILAISATACTAQTQPAASIQVAPNAKYDAWLAQFAKRARRSGIPDAAIRQGLATAGYVPEVIKKDRTQIQTRRTFEDILSIAIAPARIKVGQEKLAQHRDVLGALEQRYGVPAEILVAVWGIETRYGSRMGDIPVIASTSTLAFEGRRAAFYEKQLIAALRIIADGDVSSENMTGSWAGAMGHTQFIPTSFRSFAVDFRGDGQRDVWSDDPTDALASTAAYLAKNGWRKGLRWGGETGASGTPAGAVIRPQAGGPRFNVTRNYKVLRRYNDTVSYAVGVGHLSDLIAGRPALAQGFPPDANGLVRRERLAIQSQLTARGYDLGEVDGVIGPKTRAAIAGFQQQAGVTQTGKPSKQLLALLLQ